MTDREILIASIGLSSIICFLVAFIVARIQFMFNLPNLRKGMLYIWIYAFISAIVAIILWNYFSE